MNSFAHFDALLVGRNKKAKVLARNTSARRRGDDAIGICLHDTDVITYHRDGTIALDSGDWMTTVTKARINEFAPGYLRVISDKGRWYVSVNLEGGTGAPVPFADGMKFVVRNNRLVTIDSALTLDAAKAEDAENVKMRKAVGAFVKSITADEIAKALTPEAMAGDCWFCSMHVKVIGRPLGDATGSNQHLRDHMDEHYVVGSMIWNAVKAKGFGDPDVVMGYIVRAAQHGQVSDFATDSLRQYLRRQLTVGAVAVK